MKAPNDQALQAICRYLDDAASPEEIAELSRRLVEDPETARSFARLSRLDVYLQNELQSARRLAASGETAPEAQRPKKRAEFPRSFIALAAAAAVLAAVGVWWMVGGRSSVVGGQVIARVEKVSGFSVQVSGKSRQELAVGDEVRAGTRIETGKDGAVTLAWVGEKTGVEIGERSTLNIQRSTSKSGTRLDLNVGRLTATVAKQAPDKPFVVETPRARVTVVGTKFALMAVPGFSRVDVEEGRVKMEALADAEKAVDVWAGRAAAVGATTGRPTVFDSPGREFSTRYGGMFFKEYADLYETRGFALECLGVKDVTVTKSYRPEDLLSAVHGAGEKCLTNWVVRGVEQGYGLLLRNTSAQERQYLSVPCEPPVGGAFAIEVEFVLNGLCSGYPATGKRPGAMVLGLPEIPEKAVPYEKEFKRTSSSLRVAMHRYEVLRVGQLPDGVPVWEVRVLRDGQTRGCWWQGEPLGSWGLAVEPAEGGNASEYLMKGITVKEIEAGKKD